MIFIWIYEFIILKEKKNKKKKNNKIKRII